MAPEYNQCHVRKDKKMSKIKQMLWLYLDGVGLQGRDDCQVVGDEEKNGEPLCR